MNLIFINNDTIFCIPEEDFNDNPIQVFGEYFTAYNLNQVSSFSEWLNRYIITENVANLGDKRIKNKINGTL